MRLAGLDWTFTRLSGVALACVLLLAGCDSAGRPTDNASPSETSETAPRASSGQIQTEEVDRFDAPWALEFLPGSGDLLITERTGKLHLRNADSGKKVAVSGVPDVAVAGQGGLGDVAAGPTFDDDQMIYLSYAERGTGGTGAAVARATLRTSEGKASLENLEVIWRQRPKVSGSAHYSYRLAFDPDGKYLFVSSGDRQLMDPAQDTSNTLGSVVRLTLDGKPAESNPLADDPDAAADIWTWGHRNVLGLDFDSEGRLWASEMGPSGGDELNLIEPGGNYGWPKASHGSHYDGTDIPDHANGDGFVAPAKFWTPSISPSSLLIYGGDLISDWTGDAFIGALSGRKLLRIELDGPKAGEAETVLEGQRIRDVEQAPDGSIWVVEDEGSGRLLRLAPSTS